MKQTNRWLIWAGVAVLGLLLGLACILLFDEDADVGYEPDEWTQPALMELLHEGEGDE